MKHLTSYLLLSTLLFISIIRVNGQCTTTTFKKVVFETDSTLAPKNYLSGVGITNDSAYFAGGSRVTKTDLHGANLWDTLLNNGFYGNDPLPYIAPNGNYYTVFSNYTLVNIDPQENVVWQKTLADTGCYCNQANNIVQTADGGFLITGWKNILDTSFYRTRIFLVKTDAAGDTLWTKIIAKSPFDNEGYYAQQTSDGGYLVFANINVDALTENFKLGIIKLNSLGQEQWYKTASNSIFYKAAIHGIRTNDNACAITAQVDSGAVGTLFLKVEESGVIDFETIYPKLNDGGLLQNAAGDYLIGMQNTLYKIDATSRLIVWFNQYYGASGEKIPVQTLEQTCDDGYLLEGNSAILKSSTICCGSTFDYYKFYSYLIKTDSTLTDVAIPAGINDLSQIENELLVYPNPFAVETRLALSQRIENGTLRIVDVLGKEVKRATFSGNSYTLEKGELKEGIYFIQISSPDATNISKRIIIQ